MVAWGHLARSESRKNSYTFSHIVDVGEVVWKPTHLTALPESSRAGFEISEVVETSEIGLPR
jgi:hypothetical protein